MKTMSNIRFGLGILVMLLVFGMMAVGCDNDPDNGNGNGNGNNNENDNGDDNGNENSNDNSNDNNNDGGNIEPKTLIITMPATIYNYCVDGFKVGLFPVGTTSAQAKTFTGIVAGADNSTLGLSRSGIDPVTITIPLYNMNDDSRWTGSGAYDIYAILNGDGGHYYKRSSIDITTSTTNIQIINADEIFYMVLSITGIPTTYNGKWAHVYFFQEDATNEDIIEGKKIEAQAYSKQQVSGGSVELDMYNMAAKAEPFVPKKNSRYKIVIAFYNNQTDHNDQVIDNRTFIAIEFIASGKYQIAFSHFY